MNFINISEGAIVV